MFLLASLKTLTNSKDCSEMHVKFFYSNPFEAAIGMPGQLPEESYFYWKDFHIE
jgi:hypothetical protein